MLSDFSIILVFIIGGLLFASMGLFTARMIRPNRPNEEKLTVYECGEEPTGSAWGRFNIRFYIVALMFVLFDVELVFLFPWATVFGKSELIATSALWGWFSIAEAFIFVTILALGLAYAWRKGFIDWVKPIQTVTKNTSPVPDDLYASINQKYEKTALSEVEP